MDPQPIVDIAEMIARTPGGAFGIFIVATVTIGIVIVGATKNAGAALGAMALSMVACILGLGLSPWLFLMVVLTSLASVGLLLQMGWRGR